MRVATPIWLASYPRSGNTLLRTILWNCFGHRSATVYPNEFPGKEKLVEYVGHIEPKPGEQILFPAGNLPLIKTHEHCPPNIDHSAIYVVRDGRAASVSLWEYYGKNPELPLEAVIEGRHRFGTWAGHLESWRPWERPDTLLLKYEEMISDLPAVLEKISQFLNCDIINNSIPDRNSIAEADGRFVKHGQIVGRIVCKKSDWRSKFPDELMDKFLQINGEMFKRMGYLP